jgi:hypothetical protein
MKIMKCHKVIIIAFLLCSINTFSQFYPGLDRRIGAMPNNQPTQTQPTQREIEEMRNDQVKKQVDFLNEKLKLDDLQYIAIKNDFLKSFKEIDILLKQEFSEEEKNKQIVAIQEKTDKAILSYLNASQKEKYMALKNEKTNKKEEKEKEKKKKREAEKPLETNN